MEILILELIGLESLTEHDRLNRQRSIPHSQHPIHVRLNEFPRGQDHDDL
jgi:hypothetical protein